jgi:hypothetical protein
MQITKDQIQKFKKYYQKLKLKVKAKSKGINKYKKNKQNK